MMVYRRSHSTKQGPPLVESWSLGLGGLDQNQIYPQSITTRDQSIVESGFKVILEEKQQLVEEKDVDDIRKVLCKSFIQWF